MTSSDHELLALCRSGNDDAWRELVRRHTRRVFNVAYRFTGRVDLAEDLTQDVFVKVYRHLERYDVAEGAFGAWLATVARNLAIDHYRRSREERYDDNPETLLSLPAPQAGPVQALERAEAARLVHSGLRALPRELREVIVLCDLQELPYQDAARTLGVPLGTVKSRLNRGRLELAKRLLQRRRAAQAQATPAGRGA